MTDTNRELATDGLESEVFASVRNIVLVGVDGSDSSKQALRWARSMAQLTGSVIEAVTVWSPESSYGWGSVGWAAFPSDWDPSRDAEKMLQSTIDEVFGADRPAGLTTVVREGRPAQTLLDLSRDTKMLVVGSRGHGGFVGLLLGSVSSVCADHSTCPVLIVHGTTPPPS